MEGRRAQIRTSARQVVKNVTYTAGIISMLASLEACALPTTLVGLCLLSGGINKAISCNRDGLYLHKHGKCD